MVLWLCGETALWRNKTSPYTQRGWRCSRGAVWLEDRKEARLERYLKVANKDYHSIPYIFLSVGRNQFPQSSSWLMIGNKVFPVSVKEYSEWGGSSAKIFFSIIPCISNSFNCWLITRVFASEKCLWISLGRFAPSFSASMMQHFHLPPMTSIVTLMQQSMLKAIFFSYIFSLLGGTMMVAKIRNVDILTWFVHSDIFISMCENYQ